MLSSRLLLVDWPKDPTDRSLEHALPLGTGRAVAARISELLPGVTFSEGVGSFRRGNYQVTFTLDAAEPTAVGVEVSGVEGLMAVKRIVERTGWKPVDPATLASIDLDASRVMGAMVRLAAPATTSQAPAPVRRQARTAGWWAVAVVLLGAVAWTAGNRMAAPEQAAAGRRAADGMAASDRAIAVGQRLGHRIKRSGDLAPGFRDDPIVDQLLDFAEAALTYSSSIGDGRSPPPEVLSDTKRWQRLFPSGLLPERFGRSSRDGYEFEWSGTSCQKQFGRDFDDCASYSYVATPLTADAATPGLTYALFSTFAQIHFREDGQRPTESDPTVTTTSPSRAVKSGGPFSLARLRSALFGR